MKTKITDIRERLCDGADLVIDFATLGEYGYRGRRQPASAARERGAPGRARCLPTARADASARPAASAAAPRLAPPREPAVSAAAYLRVKRS